MGFVNEDGGIDVLPSSQAEWDTMVGECLVGLAEGPDYWNDAQRLGQLGAKSATRPLMRVVRESAEPDRRAAVLHALWMLFDARATDLFLRVGADQVGATEGERIIAVEALGISAHRPFIQLALARSLGDPSPMVRYSALCAIGAAWSVGKRIGPALRDALQRTTQDTTKVYEDGDIAALAVRLLEPCDLDRSEVQEHL
jgi:HEAT repeat protein